MAEDEDLDEMLLTAAGHGQGHKVQTPEEEGDEGEQEGKQDEAATSDEAEEDLDIDESLVRGEEDRKYLKKLPQLQREEILYEREQERREKEQREKLARAAENVQSVARKSDQRQAPTSKAQRQKALDSLVKRRRARQRGEDLSDDEEEDEEEEEEEEPDYLEGGKRKRARFPRESRWGEEEEEEADEEASVEASYADFKRICLPRKLLQDWLDTPKMEEVFTGLYVKINANPQAPQPYYRLAHVLGFSEGRTQYRLQDRSNTTTKLLRLQRDSGIKFLWRISQVSSKPPTEDEFQSWRNKCLETNRAFDEGRATAEDAEKAARVHIPTRKDVEEGVKRLKSLNTFRFSAEDVKRMVRSRKGVVINRKEKERLQWEMDKVEKRIAQETDETSRVGLMEHLESLRGKLKEVEEGLEREESSRPSSSAPTTVAPPKNKLQGNLLSASRHPSQSNELDPFLRRPTKVSNYWTTRRRSRQEDEHHDEKEEDKHHHQEQQQQQDEEQETKAQATDAEQAESAKEHKSSEVAPRGQAKRDFTEELLTLHASTWEGMPAPFASTEGVSLTDALGGKLDPVPRRPKALAKRPA